MKEDRSFENVFVMIQRNIVAILIIALVGGIAGAIFSSSTFMPPRYESTAVVYPINMYPFSDESETEQMMQLFEFVEIRDAVIDKFKLWERDNLTPGDPKYKYFVKLLYDSRVSISPTKYESVKITCQDEDPEVAKEMVEEILYQFTEKNRRITERRHADYIEIKALEYDILTQTIDSLENRMAELRKGTVILDMEGQSESLTNGYVSLLERGIGGERMIEMKKLMTDLGEKGSEVEMIEGLLEGLEEYYGGLIQEYNRELTRKKDTFNYVHRVVEPEVADKKSYPVRWLVVMLSMLGAVVAAIVFFSVRSRFV